jgi:adenosylhomocysteine nucleosidase
VTGPAASPAILGLATAGIVVGLAAEARIARAISPHVRCSGGFPGEARRHALDLVHVGVSALVSFGIAGGLDPSLKPGDLVVADRVIVDDAAYPALSDLAQTLAARVGPISGASEIVGSLAAKAALFRKAATLAVDLESGPVALVAAESGVPFIAIRAVADPAFRTLPRAALLPLDPAGRPRLAAVLGSIARGPGQIPGLIATARDTEAALKTLRIVSLSFASDRS